ncbi:MAG: GDP-mannose 4,6-dehydratase [Candidatus Saccharimonadales bacterium]
MAHKVLVTGVNGFVGRHLVRELFSRGCIVSGVGLDENIDPSIKNILAGYFFCDITSKGDVSRLPLDNYDVIINLAGLANVGESFNDPELYMRVNVETISIMGELLCLKKSQTKILAVSTGSVYDPMQEMPLSETSKLVTKSSPYTLSKIAMEKRISELKNNGLNCIIARPFNHIGPGQRPGFLLPDLYFKITDALKDNRDILVGNLKTRRDYTDVRDVVKAYACLALEKVARHDVYNVCSGRSISGEELLKKLVSKMPIENRHLKIKVDRSLVRENDAMDLYGSTDRIQNELMWKPILSIDKTIDDFILSMNTTN